MLSESGHHHAHHHHHRHHSRHNNHHAPSNSTTHNSAEDDPPRPKPPPKGDEEQEVSAIQSPGSDVASKINILAKELRDHELETHWNKGRIDVQGPLPENFAKLFAKGVAEAVGCSEGDVKLLTSRQAPQIAADVDEVTFEASQKVVSAVEDQASDVKSKLASGPLRMFLVERIAEPTKQILEVKIPKARKGKHHGSRHGADVEFEYNSDQLPFGNLQPFGREDTAHELTQSSIKESDAMVDQLERAEVAETKRSVFRALTHLRGAMVTAYDGIAEGEAGNIDKYGREHKWRSDHKIAHLAQEEADSEKWAFSKPTPC